MKILRRIDVKPKQNEKSVYNESDAVNVFVLEIGERCVLLVGEMYPEIHLQYQQEWTYFPGKQDSDASIDLLWRVELNGVYCNVVLSEFKRPHFYRHRRVGGRSRQIQSDGGKSERKLNKLQDISSSPSSHSHNFAT